jgi:acyl-CoA synthetase (AMP-forming)/AMP-acid ligase II
VHLADLFAASALRHRSRTFLTWDDGGCVSYGEFAGFLDRQVEILRGAGLPGHRIGLLAGNRPELILLWLACMRAGATAVFLNPALTEHEIRRVVSDLSLAALVGESEVDGGVAQAMLEKRPRADALTLPGPTAGAATEGAAAAVVLTSGSTGRPKYVPVPHAAYTLKATLNATALGWTAADRTACVMPLFHVGAQCETLAPALAVGASIHLASAFSASSLWQSLENHGVTHFHATGSLLAMALARAEPVAGGSLRRIVGSLRADLAEALAEALPAVDLISLYGLTECPLGTLAAPKETYRAGWVGYPYLPGSVRLRDSEIQLRNPACTVGYIGLSPSEGFTDDGWLRTGDLGKKEHGGLFLTGRIKEMIRRSGENIAPAEIEEAALRHPDVVEAAVVPFPDAVRDEEVWLLVEVRNGARPPSPPELREFLSGRIAAYKLPRYVDVLASVPKTGSNKIDKPALLAGLRRPGWDAMAPEVGFDERARG